MDKVIITGLLIIAGVVTTVLLYNTVYPAIVQSGDALTVQQRHIDDRLQTQIRIIHAAPIDEVSNEVRVWIKNVGGRRIAPVESCDVFFGPEGAFTRMSYGSDWSSYEIENGSAWDPTTTLRITLMHKDNIDDDTRYYIKVATPNGIWDEYYFSK